MTLTESGREGCARALKQQPGASVLVVDDDFQLRELYQVVMESAGHRVHLAQDGQQGLELYRRALDEGAPYDLVILDLNMPVMDGRQCLDRLLGLDPGARVMLATGHAAEELGPWSGRLAGLVYKPVGVGNLLDSVARALSDISQP
jgi:CheY-like chemotaxis protein